MEKLEYFLPKTKSSKILFMLQSITSVTGLQATVYDQNLTSYSLCSAQENIFKNFFLLNCKFDLESIIKGQDISPYEYTDALFLSWVIIPLNNSNSILVLGPTLNSDLNTNILQRKLEYSSMSIKSQIEFQKMIKQIPVIVDTQLIKYASIIYNSIYDISTPTYILHNNADSNKLTNSTFNDLFEKNNISTFHGSRLFEQEMKHCISHGIKKDFFSYTTNNNDVVVGNMVPDNPLRQYQDMIIILVALAARAAIDGGMDGDLAYTYSDLFIQKIEACENTNDLISLTPQIYNTYTDAVIDAQSSNYSSLVKYITSYIKNNIYKNIQLQEMADILGYDMYYMSRLFKKETGTTVKKYIITEKINIAKLLLVNTNLPIIEISEQLNFCSPSYFNSQFKNIVGTTPLQYRLNN
ncbi:MAG: AraC family transcriptional regulator [Lachnospiraceae bacterium]|nr:AraC family transcriptional regulator [Lachnospiraceae bacterium]